MFAKRRLSGTPWLLAASLLIPSAIPVLTTAQAAPPAHAAAKQKKCPNPKPTPPTEKPPVYVRVTGVSCRTAYALARKVKVSAPRGCLVHTDAKHIRLTRPCRVDGYRCTSRPLVGGLVLEATCKGGAKVVRFQAQY
jgi:hypothetical protein